MIFYLNIVHSLHHLCNFYKFSCDQIAKMVSCTTKSPLQRWWTDRKYKYAHGSLSSYTFPNVFKLRCALFAMEHFKFTMDTPFSTVIPFKFTQKIIYCIIFKLHVKTCNHPHHIVFVTIHMALHLQYIFQMFDMVKYYL